MLVTGAGGYIGRLLVEALAREPGALETIVATDVRLPEPDARLVGVTYEVADVRTHGSRRRVPPPSQPTSASTSPRS